MLAREDLVANFSGVTDITADIVRCKDVLPMVTFFNYVRPAGGDGEQDFLLISEGNPDDEFAQAVLSNLAKTPPGDGLKLQEIAQNKYGFEALLLAPSAYHAYFKGRLDDKRAMLTFCIPIHRCEFSVAESVEEFTALRRDVVPILSWTRAPAPKTVLRFDNPKTRGGTGARYVLVKLPLVLREVDNIEGVVNAFIELMNYRGQVIEILSPRPQVFTYIRDRNDADRVEMSKPELLKNIHEFLTS